MATIISNSASSIVVSNLDTYQFTVPLASLYRVSCRASEIPPSGLQITINQNGSQLAQTVVPAASQNHTELTLIVNAAASDVLQIVLSSAVASDSLMQAVKAIIKFSPGQV